MKRMHAFLVMGFIIATTLAIGFFIQKEEEKDARIKVEKLLSSVMKERDNLASEMFFRVSEREKIISYLSASLYKQKMINAKLSENIGRSSRRFSTASQDKKPVELEKIIVSSLLEAEGKILAVDRQNDLVVINLGSTNNLKNGDKLGIYRGDSLIANAQLVKVQDKISAAMVLSEANTKGAIVEVNDIVK
ncbi:MAG: hypothetical protein Q8O12_06375 [Candidatus Omnitrophota bacterium]|nr:hypothetical protein [Candidatus Omnitrophota bacterium]